MRHRCHCRRAGASARPGKRGPCPAVGKLLSKLMVIKATGDYEGIRKLVEEKGIHFDAKLRDEVGTRVRAVEVPSELWTPP